MKFSCCYIFVQPDRARRVVAGLHNNLKLIIWLPALRKKIVGRELEVLWLARGESSLFRLVFYSLDPKGSLLWFVGNASSHIHDGATLSFDDSGCLDLVWYLVASHRSHLAGACHW